MQKCGRAASRAHAPARPTQDFEAVGGGCPGGWGGEGGGVGGRVGVGGGGRGEGVGGLGEGGCLGRLTSILRVLFVFLDSSRKPLWDGFSFGTPTRKAFYRIAFWRKRQRRGDGQRRRVGQGRTE